jgi:hypothetical protein
LFTQLKNQIGLAHGGQPGLCESHAPPRRFKQGIAQSALQLPNLRTHGLHRHIQPGSGPGQPPLGDHPEVIQVAVVELSTHIQFLQKYFFFIICFYFVGLTAMLPTSCIAELHILVDPRLN